MTKPKLYTHAIEAMQLYLDSLPGDWALEEKARLNTADIADPNDSRKISAAKYILADCDLDYTVRIVAPFVDALHGKKAHQVLGISQDASADEIRRAKQAIEEEAGGRGYSEDQVVRSRAVILMENPELKADVYAMQDKLAEEIRMLRQYASGVSASLAESKDALRR